MPVILFTSCRSTWNQDDNATLHNACIADAKTWQHPPADPEAYCNCVITKVKQKYPDDNEAMKHIDSLAYDQDLDACRDATSKP